MPPRPSIVTVRFVRSHGAYNKGVEAGFSPAQAAILVKSRSAIIVNGGVSAADAAAPTTGNTKTPPRGVVQKG